MSTTSQSSPVARRTGIDPRLWKFAIFALVAALVFLTPQETRAAAQTALSDAYVAVTSFVALTLIIFYVLEKRLKLDTAVLLKRYEGWQVPVAAFMGITPGCGGAIIVITQFVLGRISFGSVVAVLTGTMGDAAFLLLAREPQTFLLVIAISFVTGTLSGYLVDKTHGTDFMRPAPKGEHDADLALPEGALLSYPKPVTLLWFAMLVPGIMLGLGNAFQSDTDLWFGPLAGAEPTKWVGVFGALFCLALWAALTAKGFSLVNMMAHPQCHDRVKTGHRVMFETSFVTSWVIVAFLMFELGTHWAAFDLGAVFQSAAPLLPLFGVLVGFIPGCGPQIIVTSLYLEGLVPFSAQLANAISNDGDALFPAIALAPRAALLATFYTAIPALLLGYIFYFFFP